MGYICMQAISFHLLISSSNFNKASVKNNQIAGDKAEH